MRVKLKDTVFYEQALGLKAPWTLKHVDLCVEAQKVTIEVEFNSKQVWADPTNEQAQAHIYGWTVREWRHLDTCQFQTVIKARVPRLKYSNGQVQTLAVPWAERFACGSNLRRAFVNRLLQACLNAKKICALTGLSWTTVNTILNRAVDVGVVRRQADKTTLRQAARR